MSGYRPHVSPGAKPPPFKDKSLLAGKPDLWTPQRRAEWLRKQGGAARIASVRMGERYALIMAATRAGRLGWEKDPNHYRDGSPYCKCPGGSVDAHNARFEQCLEG